MKNFAAARPSFASIEDFLERVLVELQIILLDIECALIDAMERFILWLEKGEFA